jgi:uncharacterized LabA/DUF88 family protein
VIPKEFMLRVLYYDSPQFRGRVQLPVSGKQTTFSANDAWLDDLAAKSRFAVRRGTIGFRGWRPGMVPIKSGSPLTDADFRPIFEQKGVDMRIGLDIASMSELNSVDRIVLVSADTDMVPAMKHARKAGIEVVIVQLPPPAQTLHKSILSHSDLVRSVTLP